MKINNGDQLPQTMIGGVNIFWNVTKTSATKEVLEPILHVIDQLSSLRLAENYQRMRATYDLLWQNIPLHQAVIDAIDPTGHSIVPKEAL